MRVLKPILSPNLLACQLFHTLLDGSCNGIHMNVGTSVTDDKIITFGFPPVGKVYVDNFQALFPAYAFHDGINQTELPAFFTVLGHR